MNTGKLFVIFIGLLVLLLVYLYGTRFEIVATGQDSLADAYKLNRITGKTWMVMENKIYLVGEFKRKTQE